jgi:hypothetical protein
MRTIKLPDLLIEVDNDLRLTTEFFMSPSAEKSSTLIDNIGAIIASWRMAALWAQKQCQD